MARRLHRHKFTKVVGGGIVPAKKKPGWYNHVTVRECSEPGCRKTKRSTKRVKLDNG